MTSMLTIILMTATVAMASISEGLRNPESSSGIERTVYVNRLNKPRLHYLNKRFADPQEPSAIIESDEPTDKILQRFSKGDKVAELVDGDYKGQEGRRQKRRTRAVLIRVCNRRTRRCKNILVVRRY